MARWIAWLVLLGLWTFALLSPSAPEVAGAVLPPAWRFWAAKGLHVAAYAFFAFAVAFLPAGGRWAAWLGLLVHAALSEWLQTFTGRTGAVSDVLIDCAGIALGLLAAWLFHRSRRRVGGLEG